jgi:hypothetical protein
MRRARSFHDSTHPLATQLLAARPPCCLAHLHLNSAAEADFRARTALRASYTGMHAVRSVRSPWGGVATLSARDIGGSAVGW